TRPDILVAQAQDSINRFSHVLKPDGILIVDSYMSPTPPANIRRVFKVPATSSCTQSAKGTCHHQYAHARGLM
ncbi:MAG: hypothetical protein KAT75_02015, partial [Dehalococcoidia bacterium]|nr:hypothetical protein [Dehalococcoidia bacterium]